MGTPRTILIVDDEDSIIALLVRVLAATGHVIRTATDAETALQSILESPPNVVICDLHLPGANGLWLTDRIPECAPYTAVVLTTGDATVLPVVTLRTGVSCHLLKPFRAHEVLKAVEDGLRWSDLMSETRPQV